MSTETRYVDKNTIMKCIENALERKNVKIVDDGTKINNLATPAEIKEFFTSVKSDNKKEEKKKKKGYKKKIEFSDKEMDDAMLDLVYPDLLPFLSSYPRSQAYWSDPVYNGQTFCVHSFVPSPGANPDKDGIYGMVKCRGTFNTEEEMDRRCQEIIKNFDSCHMLFQGYTGKPFPLTTQEKYCKEIKEVDIKEEMKEIIKENMKQQKEKEQTEQKEIEERRQELLKRVEDEKKGMPDMLETYTQMRVKRANLIFSIIDIDMNRKKQIEYLRDCLKDIEKLDNEYPTYKTSFEDKYKQACEDAGIQNNTIAKYLTGPIPFDI